MDLGIKDRVALVAAASKGIGFAAARELAKEGARVFLCSRDEKRASDAAQKLHDETGATVAGIGADVTDNESVERFVNLALERAGRAYNLSFTETSVTSLTAAVGAGLGVMALPRCVSDGADLAVWDDAPLPPLPAIVCNVSVRSGADDVVDQFAQALADAYAAGRASPSPE